LPREFRLNTFERQSHLAFHHAFGRVIARERPADEIVRSGIADVLKNAGINVAQEDKAARQRLRLGGRYPCDGYERDHNCFHEPAPPSSWPDLFRPSTSFLRLTESKTWMPGIKPGMTNLDISGDNSQAPYSRLPDPPSAPIALVLMTPASKSTFVLGHRHLLGIEGLSAPEITGLLDLSEEYVELNRQVDKKRTSLRGRTQVNLFFEASTRTQSSFELAGKRLGADVMNMSVSSSSIRKGETLMDTAVTLNAMHPDILVVRHHASGAVELLARKVDGSVINAGDGAHEHPTQALLDALTIRRNKGRLEGLVIAICGDVMHSRVARSNILLLNTMGARVRVVAPSTLLPRGIERMGVEVARDMREGLNGADIVMMLRLQRERMNGSFVPSSQEYFHYFGLDQKKLAYAKPDALVMHPGPMNRGVEIDSIVADGAQSLIREQVEMGVAVRMAVLEALARNLPNA
jgi:aspartate carbamoyltransferase catalytic subunit